MGAVRNNVIRTMRTRIFRIALVGVIGLLTAACPACPVWAARDATEDLASANMPVNPPKLIAKSSGSIAQKDPAKTEAKFQLFLNDLRAEATLRGIDEKITEAAFANLHYRAQIINFDQKQPEHTETLAQYVAQRLTQARIRGGKKYWREHKELLQSISDHYRVAPQYLLALWAVESDYGANRPKQPIIAALASLAFDRRRGDFFRRELFIALEIAQKLNLNPNQMMSSWAGAMGQIQFMPSSFVNYAVHWKNVNKLNPVTQTALNPHATQGDHPDIWHNQADILASIANYLHQSGWRDPQIWGGQVTVPPDVMKLAVARAGNLPEEAYRSWQEWMDLGVRMVATSPAANPSALAIPTQRAALLRPRADEEDFYLLYDNFNVLLKWNYSALFGIVVGQLADRLAAPGD